MENMINLERFVEGAWRNEAIKNIKENLKELPSVKIIA